MSLTRFFEEFFPHKQIELYNIELINIPTQSARVFIRGRQRGASTARTNPTPIKDNRVLFPDNLTLKCKMSKRKPEIRIRLSVRLENESGNRSTRFGIAHIEINPSNPLHIEVPLEKCDCSSILSASVRHGDRESPTAAVLDDDEKSSPSTGSIEAPLSDELLEAEELAGIDIDEDRFSGLEAQVDEILLKILKK